MTPRTWLSIAGLAAVMITTVAWAVSMLAGARPDLSALMMAFVLMPTAVAIGVHTLLIAGLLARSRAAHVAAIVVLGYQLTGYGSRFLSTEGADPLTLVATGLVSVGLAALVLDRNRYWRPRPTNAAPTTQRAVGANLRILALVYAVLAIAILSMCVWIFYHALFGPLLYPRPPDWAIPAAALAVLAMGLGAGLLSTHAFEAAVFGGGGLADEGIASQVFKLGVTVLAIAGIGLLSLLAWRDRTVTLPTRD